MASYVFKLIRPDEISRDFPYRLRYRLEDPALARSVAKRGVLHPILTAGPERTVVSGHRRFQAACDLGLKEIGTFEIQGPVSGEDLFILALLSNWNQGWSDLDRALAVRRAVETYRMDETLLEEVLPALGLTPQRHVADEYLQVARLHPFLLELIADGRLVFRGAKILTRFSAADQETFGRSVALKAAFSANQLLQVGEWLQDLLKLEKTDLKTYVETHGLETILDHPVQDRRAKADRLHAALRALRFPRIAGQEKKFSAFSRELREESGDLTVEAPAFFEGEGFILKARVRKPESLERVLEILSRRRNSLNSLFEIML